ncbi:glutamate receptor ionotropic, kainate 2-like isoform X1 [Diabrotica virgifera virgifera]|uniref:Glutamate receptor ionotropic, kainate 2-like isoform X1 n=1 Tax=Diabrotica virgifera virgifera TaxID=50390 RepID=A0A6P7H2S4_DIAVI|nr:glutamate receptor ionotropic, kainate 2-like isoform X1 [Diabrotica virgifera virgifera]
MFKCARVVIFVILVVAIEGIRRKPVNIAIFLNDDDQYEISSIAVISVIRRVNLYHRVESFLHPHIFKVQKHEVLRAGQLVCQLVEKGIAAIFGPESPEINDMIQSVSSTLQIPQFQTFWNPKLATLAYRQPVADRPNQVFNLHPSPKALSKALATLVRENDWKSYTILYENDNGLLRLQETLKQLNPRDPVVAFKALGPKENLRSVLKEVKSSGVSHFILDCEADRIMDILRLAQELKLLSEFHSYILTNLDSHTLNWSELGSIRSNITAMRLLDPESINMKNAALVWNQTVKLDVLDTIRNPAIQKELDYLRSHRFLYNIKTSEIHTKTPLLYDALNLFISVYADLEVKNKLTVNPLNCKEDNVSTHGQVFFDTIKEEKKNLRLLLEPLTGEITKFDSMGYRRNFKLQIIELDSKKFRVTGSWDSILPDKIDLALSTKERDEELLKKIQKRNFRVVSRLGDPYLMEAVDPNGKTLYGNDRYEGYSMDLMKEICKPENLNCSFTFHLVPDGKYGNYDSKTKQWNGLIKELLEYRAELGICDLTITYERRKAVDFTSPFMSLGISILYAKPTKQPPNLLTFSHPFSFDVWIYIATSYLLISLIMFLTARINPNDWESTHPCNQYSSEVENIWTWRNCCWLTLGSSMAAGCDLLPKGISTRMVVAMWWFFALIMTACYTANMTAFLTSSRMGLTIESAEDLAGQNKIKYGCLKGGATSSFFKDTNFSTYHRMWVQMESAEPNVFETNNKDGVKRVLSSKRKYAFIMESSTIEYEMERNCELTQVGNNLDSKGYGIAMPFNAPYRKSINAAILKMQEMGILHTLKTKWWKEMNGGGQCTKELSDEAAAVELGLDNVGGVFVVLGVGVGLSLIMAICEFLWNVRKVAVVQKLTPKEALIQELKFAVDIWARKKNVTMSGSKAISMEEIDEKCT